MDTIQHLIDKIELQLAFNIPVEKDDIQELIDYIKTELRNEYK